MLLNITVCSISVHLIYLSIQNEPVGTLNRAYGVNSPDFDESGAYAEIDDRSEVFH